MKGIFFLRRKIRNVKNNRVIRNIFRVRNRRVAYRVRGSTVITTRYDDWKWQWNASPIYICRRVRVVELGEGGERGESLEANSVGDGDMPVNVFFFLPR